MSQLNYVPNLRFLVKRKGTEYLIKDLLVNEQVTIKQSLLKISQFNISRWYAMKRARALTLDKKVVHHCTMGLAIDIVAHKLLTDGIRTYYPCTRPDLDPKLRFSVQQPCSDKEEYLTVDKDLNISPSLHSKTPQLIS